MKYLLDTNIIVGYLRDKPGKRKLIKKLFTAGDLAASLITYGELEYGARKAKDYRTEKGKVEQCLADLEIEVLSLKKRTMEIFAQIKRGLELKGSGLDDFDLLIGAAALENNTMLVTDNAKHFDRLPGLTVYKLGKS